MASRGGVRWSEAQLTNHLARDVTPASVPRAAPGGAPPAVQAPAKSAAAGPLQGRLARAITSIKTARPHGTYVRDLELRLTFPGALTLSPNELYKLSHYQRVPYRTAWHEAVYWAVLELSGSTARPRPFTRFTLRMERSSAQLCDPDALNGYFKYVIDGLRYANVIVDDKACNLLDLDAMQVQGPPGVWLHLVNVGDALDRAPAAASAPAKRRPPRALT